MSGKKQPIPSGSSPTPCASGSKPAGVDALMELLVKNPQLKDALMEKFGSLDAEEEEPVAGSADKGPKKRSSAVPSLPAKRAKAAATTGVETAAAAAAVDDALQGDDDTTLDLTGEAQSESDGGSPRPP